MSARPIPTAEAGPDAVTGILVLRALGLGDFVTAVPALRALERRFPDRRRVLAGPAWYRDLLELAGLRWEVRATEPLRTPTWPEPAPPDLAVNLHGRGPQSTAALAALAPRRLWAHDLPDGSDRPGPPWPGRIHDAEIWCGLLRAYGVAADPDDLWWPAPDGAPAPAPGDAVSPVPGAGAAIIHPGASAASRRWPAERFAAVARHLGSLGLRVLVTGSRDELPAAERVARHAGLDRASVLAGRTGVRELARLVSEADLVVCGDTGVVHLATAYRTPSVRLFGPVSPALWGPRVDGGIHACLWEGAEGDPHACEIDPGLASITVADVLQACADVLARTGARP
jgi:ADP-heptose:LPS heptosyltransferase